MAYTLTSPTLAQKTANGFTCEWDQGPDTHFPGQGLGISLDYAVWVEV